MFASPENPCFEPLWVSELCWSEEPPRRIGVAFLVPRRCHTGSCWYPEAIQRLGYRRPEPTNGDRRPPTRRSSNVFPSVINQCRRCVVPKFFSCPRGHPLLLLLFKAHCFLPTLIFNFLRSSWSFFPSPSCILSLSPVSLTHGLCVFCLNSPSYVSFSWTNRIWQIITRDVFRAARQDRLLP